MDLYDTGSNDSEISWDPNMSSDEEEQSDYGSDYDSDISLGEDEDESIIDTSGFTYVYAYGGVPQIPTGPRRPRQSQTDDVSQPSTSRSTPSTQANQPGISRTTRSNQLSTSGSQDVPKVSPPEDPVRPIHPKDKRATPPIQFSGVEAGVNHTNCPVSDTPCQAFMSFVDNEIVQNVCGWTNKRAHKFLGEDRRKINGIYWNDIVPKDLYIYLALVFNMGIVKHPRVSMYWSKDPVMGGPKLFTHKVMSRNRFLNITKFLRFSNPEEVQRNDPKTRIESFLDLLRARCQAILNPGLHIAVDEALVLWKGRLKFKQFIRTKRSRFGIKIFLTCPGDKNWQVISIILYFFNL